MTKDETLSIIQLITTYYPNFRFKNETPDERQLILMAWHRILANYDFEEVRENVFLYAEFNSFVPKVADITGAHKTTHTTPNLEETRLMFERKDREQLEIQKQLQDPEEQRKIAEVKASIRATLGMPKREEG